jgi:hypothetical protein
VSGFWLVAGVVALFFACGILTGVLGVMALSAMRDHHRPRARRRHPSRYAQDQAGTLELTSPRRPRGPDWEGQRRSDEIGESPPPWPGGRRDLTAVATEEAGELDAPVGGRVKERRPPGSPQDLGGRRRVCRVRDLAPCPG